jgi:hypothetical protein
LQNPGGHHVDWPTAQSATVEQGVYFDNVMAPLAVPFEEEDEGTPSANKSATTPTVNIEGSLTDEEALKASEISIKTAKTARTGIEAPPPVLVPASTHARRKSRLLNCTHRINQGEDKVFDQQPIAVSAPASTSTDDVATNKDVAKGAAVSTRTPPAMGLPVEFLAPGLAIKKVEDIGEDPGGVFAALVAIGIEGT